MPVIALVLCVYPYVVTGAIHLDGFMDVVDAVRSCAGKERRREILKDSHVRVQFTKNVPTFVKWLEERN